MTAPSVLLPFEEHMKRCRHNAEVIMATSGLIRLVDDNRTICDFDAYKQTAGVLAKLVANPKSNAILAGQPLPGFINEPAWAALKGQKIPTSKPDESNEAKAGKGVVTESREGPVAPPDVPPAIKPPDVPLRKAHKLPTKPSPAGTSINWFVAPNGELMWPDVKKTENGFVPRATCANARVAIMALKVECRHDLFHGQSLVGGHLIEQWSGELSDHACQMLRVLIHRHFGFDPGHENVNNAAVQLCLGHSFDPVIDYLAGLEWDGKRRIDTWLIDYFGAEDTELNRVIGRLVLVAAVRRARQPGCKFDQVLVLEGREGTQKSTAIAVMAGKENFSDQTILGLDEKRQMELLKGRWLYEIAELAGMRRSEVEAVKAFTARTMDRGRPAYGRHVIDQPRRCIFIATTNDDSYLKSQTGNRRFWPVKTSKIAINALTRDRDQLWAEAVAAEAGEESIQLPERLWTAAAAEQEKRLEHDPWDDILESVCGEVHRDFDGYQERVSSKRLISEYLKIPPDRQTKETEKKLAQCMRRLGWSGPRKMRIGDSPGSRPYPQRGYFRPSPDDSEREGDR